MHATPSCIYCGGVADSLEHPLLAAFGEFEDAPLLEDRICRPCNNERLGILDEQYVRCGPEGFLRRHYGIRGRQTHREINPFHRGSAGGRRLEMHSFDEKLGAEVLMEGEAGNYHQARQLVFIENDGSAHHVLLRDGMTPDQLRNEVKQLPVTDTAALHMICAPEEWDIVLQLVRSAWPNVTVGDGAPAANTFNGAVTTVRLTERYFRAVAKAGFHYFLTQFPEFTGHETIFDDIKRFILEDGHKVDHANKYVKKRTHALLVEMLKPGSRPAGWRAHLLAAEIKTGACRAHVQTFITEDWPAPTYTVLLGNAPDHPDRAAGHIYIYFPDGPHGKYAGFAHNLTATRLDMVAPPLAPAIRAD